MVTINISFKLYLKNFILNDANINKFYTHAFPNTHYNLDDILDGILYVLKTSICWRDSRSVVKWNSLYFHFSRFVKFNIFKKLFHHLRTIFMSKHSTNVQLIDSSFVMNKYGKNKIKRNKFFKNKNCNKISTITDIHGVPISILVNSGNVHDLSFINRHMNDLFILNKKFNQNIILLADKSYESKKVRRELQLKKYSLMIPKKKNMIVNYPFNKELYKNRIFVEHTFQKLKNFRRISIRYDALIRNYLAFVFLGASFLILKHII